MCFEFSHRYLLSISLGGLIITAADVSKSFVGENFGLAIKIFLKLFCVSEIRKKQYC